MAHFFIAQYLNGMHGIVHMYVRRIVGGCIHRCKHTHTIFFFNLSYSRFSFLPKKPEQSTNCHRFHSLVVKALLLFCSFSWCFLRARFELLCTPIFNKCIQPIRPLLEKVKLTTTDINKVRHL